MIRSVIALFIFSVILNAYIIMRPSSDDRPKVAQTADVTRAQTDSILGSVPNVTPISAAAIQAPVRNTAPGLGVPTDGADMTQTAANVLAGLGLNVDANAQRADPMRDMTAGVLAGIGAITGKKITASSAPAAAKSALELLVVQALKEGQSDDYINTIVNEAASAGAISVPQVLVTSDGKVDTSVLLSSIITQAKIAAGGPAPAIPVVPSGDGTGVEVRVVQRATDTQQYRFYTVSRGDSLGAIAVKFYGNVDKYAMIYQANRNVLSSPNAIQVGQRLAIPDLAG
tara:strand:- start:4873 stop:5727 length:855 start_codon:yes stop_codon:yes gene_type:complete